MFDISKGVKGRQGQVQVGKVKVIQSGSLRNSSNGVATTAYPEADLCRYGPRDTQ